MRPTAPAGLSLDRAPPLWVPMRFFVTAPIFGVLAAAIAFLDGPEIYTHRWTAGLLAVTHLFTLGVLTMVMCGALFQLLPVVAGSPVARPVAVARVVHPLLVAGALGLAVGLHHGRGVLTGAAAVVVAIALAVFLVAAAGAVRRVPRVHDTVRGIAAALSALCVTLALGLWLAAGHGIDAVALPRGSVTDLHAAWGGVGWAGILMVAVAYQVVPMFQLTPEYPALVRRLLAPGLLGVLLAWTGTRLAARGEGVEIAAAAAVAALLVVFSGVTLTVQSRRRRRRPDATLDFWRLGLAALGVSVASWSVSVIDPSGAAAMSAGLAFFVGFALSVLTGMLYKIVPFVVWLHLQRGPSSTSGAPLTVGAILPAGRGRWHLRVHAVAAVALVAAPWAPALLARPAACVLALSFVLLGVNVVHAARVYARVAARAG